MKKYSIPLEEAEAIIRERFGLDEDTVVSFTGLGANEHLFFEKMTELKSDRKFVPAIKLVREIVDGFELKASHEFVSAFFNSEFEMDARHMIGWIKNHSHFRSFAWENMLA